MPENISSSNVSDAFLVACFTALAYGVSYAFEAGYASYFNMPVGFIEVSPEIMLKSSGFILAAIGTIFPTVNLFWTFIPRKQSPLASALKRVLLGAIIIGVLISPYLMDGMLLSFFFGLVSFVVFMEIIFPLLMHRDSLGYEDRLRFQEICDANSKPYQLLSNISDSVGEKRLLIIFLVLYAIFFSHALGLHQARTKSDFIFIEGASGQVVLSQYGDTFVTQSCDMFNKKLVGVFKVFKISDGLDNSLKLKPLIVGPLKPAEIESAVTVTNHQ